MLHDDDRTSANTMRTHGYQVVAGLQRRRHALSVHLDAEWPPSQPNEHGGCHERGEPFQTTVIALISHRINPSREGDTMLAKLARDLFRPRRTVHAHCDLPCGVYDPAQARIEADSVKAIQERYQDAGSKKSGNETEDEYKSRCLIIKEERADLVKHHLWVLWTDYFKPEHTQKYPQLHDLFWNATKEAGIAKKSQDPGQGQKLLDLIGEIDKIFWETKKAA
jgi:nickel superoxide dismutase